MRWVTYLSPSGGTERSGIVDDGCVHGHPGGIGLFQLLDGDPAEVAAARDRALDAPVEIIVEFETRLCAPVRPDAAVPVRTAEGPGTALVAPELIRGTDDGVPAGGSFVGGLRAAVGAAALHGASGRLLGCTAVCLWTAPGTPDPVALTVGPAVVTPDELDGPLAVRAESEGGGAAAAIDLADLAGAPGVLTAAVGAPSPVLAPGGELSVDAGPLGEYEIRLGEGY
ncbi:hypothetical protein [Nocardiopsis coralliicola]